MTDITESTLSRWMKAIKKPLSLSFFNASESGAKPIPVSKIEKAKKLRANIESLTKELSTVEGELEENVSFFQALPDAQYSDLHGQLFKNEGVHPVDTVEQLVDERIGDEGSNKLCFVRLVETKEKKDITAGIYIALQTVSPNENSDFEKSIPGLIDDVKYMKKEGFEYPSPESDDVVVALLYTISNGKRYDWERGGRSLASDIYKELHKRAEEKGAKLCVSSISPIRSINAHLKQRSDFEGLISGNDKDTYRASPAFLEMISSEEGQREMRKEVLSYLLEQGDEVMNFHLGNGAYIGDINFNPENAHDWVTINYVYHPDVKTVKNNSSLYANRSLNREIKPVASHLQTTIQKECPYLLSKVCCVIESGENIVRFQNAQKQELAHEQKPAVGQSLQCS